MAILKLITLAVIIVSIGAGAAFGLLISSNQPLNQKYSFAGYLIQTSSAVHCSPNPKNYSNWLEIQVIGNRTGMNFKSVTLYGPGNNIRVDLPLNQTSYATYKETNSSLESIYVGIPNYFNLGDSLSISLTYSIGRFTPQSKTLPQTPLNLGMISC